MFMKKLVKDATISSVSSSLRQKSKISLGKVKHLGNKADLFFKLPASNSNQYKNIDISSNEKLGHKIGKNLGYSADSKSDKPLDSCTNIPKAKCFNFGTVKTSLLGFCDFGSTVDDVDMDLPSFVSLESSLCLVVSVKEKFCFELIKSFALNIGLLAVSGSTLCNKLKSVKKLFYKIDGFGNVLTPSKFPGIVKASFISESSFALAKQLAVSENLVISVDLPKLAIESVLVKYEKIFSIKMQLIGLWQKALVIDLVASKWSILLGKNLACVVKANANKQIHMVRRLAIFLGTWYLMYEPTTAICSTPVFKGVNLIWAGLSSSKCATCGNFGYFFSGCGSGKKNFEQSFKKKFLCSNSDKRHLVFIYTKKQAPMFCPISFGSVTWASVISSSSKNLFFTPFVEINSGMRSVNGSTSVVIILALCVSVFKHLLENVFDQMVDILHKLDRLLVVSSVSFPVLPTLEHNPVLNMTVDALLL
ncbi:hypothetical protein G9A89_020305 [Geosiphon pyriformis]|nr:hypothetical protein G9A89_020305 [Geosiphon pyriformis]